MVRIALLEKKKPTTPKQTSVTICQGDVFCVFFLFLILANTLICMGVLNPGWIAPLFIASLCPFVGCFLILLRDSEHFKNMNVKAYEKGGVCKLVYFSICFQDT